MDRVCEESCHRRDVDLADALAGRKRNRVRDDEFAKFGGLDAVHSLPRQHRMDDTGFHGDSATLEYEARRLHESSTARYFVVDDESDFPRDVTDQIHSARDFLVPKASLVHNRDWQVQAGRVVADIFRFTHVAGDEHVVREVTALA